MRQPAPPPLLGDGRDGGVGDEDAFARAESPAIGGGRGAGIRQRSWCGAAGQRPLRHLRQLWNVRECDGAPRRVVVRLGVLQAPTCT